MNARETKDLFEFWWGLDAHRCDPACLLPCQGFPTSLLGTRWASCRVPGWKSSSWALCTAPCRMRTSLFMLRTTSWMKSILVWQGCWSFTWPFYNWCAATRSSRSKKRNLSHSKPWPSPTQVQPWPSQPHNQRVKAHAVIWPGRKLDPTALDCALPVSCNILKAPLCPQSRN